MCWVVIRIMITDKADEVKRCVCEHLCVSVLYFRWLGGGQGILFDKATGIRTVA